MGTKKRQSHPSNPKAPVKAHAHPGAPSGHACSVCGRSFPLLSSLSQHMRRHTQEKPYKCPYCEHRTAQKGSLKAHIRGHKLGLFAPNRHDPTSKPPAPQPIDIDPPAAEPMDIEPPTAEPMDTKSPAAEPTDIEAEKSPPAVAPKKGTKKKRCKADGEGEHGCVCIICGQAFPQPLLLKAHMKTHSGYLLYRCRICGRRFRQAWYLQTHVQSHRSKARRKPSDEPVTINGVPQDPLSLVNEVCPYELCGTCGNFFPDSESLQVHEQLHNPGAPRPPPPPPLDAEQTEEQRKRLFMAGLGLMSVKEKKPSGFNAPAGRIPQLDPVCSYQTWKLATTRRLPTVHPSQKTVAQDADKAKQAKQDKKRKQSPAAAAPAATTDPQGKKAKFESETEHKPRIPSAAKTSHKKTPIPLNGLGHAFYEELHNKKAKEVPAGSTDNLVAGGMNVFFCRYCNFCTGSILSLRSHQCGQPPDPLRTYATAPSSSGQSDLKAFRYAGCSDSRKTVSAGVKGTAPAGGALDLSLPKSKDKDLVTKDGLVSHKCPFCPHTSYFPEALWAHQQIEHKVNAGSPAAPKWAVCSSAPKSLKTGSPPQRRTGPPPFLEGKDCPALTPQRGPSAKPQEAAAQRSSRVSASKSRPRDSGTSERAQKAGLPKDKQKPECGGNVSGVQPPLPGGSAFPRSTRQSYSPDRSRAAAGGFPQEGLGFVLARQPAAGAAPGSAPGSAPPPPAPRPQPRRHSLDSSSGPKNLNLWTALNMLAQRSYSDPAHGAPGKADSAGDTPGDLNILGLLRGRAPHDLTSLCQQWSFIDPSSEPKALFPFSGNLAKVHSLPESSLVTGCSTPPSGSLHKGS